MERKLGDPLFIIEYIYLNSIDSENLVTMSNKIYSLRVHQVNLIKLENLVSIYYLLNLCYVAIMKNECYREYSWNLFDLNPKIYEFLFIMFYIYIYIYIPKLVSIYI